MNYSVGNHIFFPLFFFSFFFFCDASWLVGPLLKFRDIEQGQKSRDLSLGPALDEISSTCTVVDLTVRVNMFS